MRFQIPEDALTARLYRVGPAIIEADEGESLVDIALTIARLSIERAPGPRGLGVFAALRAQELGIELVDDAAIDDFRRMLEEESEINIDYWRGRAVKLELRLEGDRLTLSVASWTDRCDVMADTTPAFVIDALREMLEAAASAIQ